MYVNGKRRMWLDRRKSFVVDGHHSIERHKSRKLKTLTNLIQVGVTCKTIPEFHL